MRGAGGELQGVAAVHGAQNSLHEGAAQGCHGKLFLIFYPLLPSTEHFVICVFKYHVSCTNGKISYVVVIDSLHYPRTCSMYLRF